MNEVSVEGCEVVIQEVGLEVDKELVNKEKGWEKKF
jgi:hypothetical protein